MNVGQVIESVREWVDHHGRHIDGFRAAHLMGGILTLPHDTAFPAYRDVDLNIVCDGVEETTTHDVAYNGLIVEYSLISINNYRTPEEILANPELAANLARDSILADPYGLLGPLRQVVASQYAEPRWVAARVGYEQQMVLRILAGLHHEAEPAKALWLLTSATLFLSGLLAEASLRAPTHRRSLVLMREVLYGQGHADVTAKSSRPRSWSRL
jgi:hypothetical protein